MSVDIRSTTSKGDTVVNCSTTIYVWRSQAGVSKRNKAAGFHRSECLMSWSWVRNHVSWAHLRHFPCTFFEQSSHFQQWQHLVKFTERQLGWYSFSRFYIICDEHNYETAVIFTFIVANRKYHIDEEACLYNLCMINTASKQHLSLHWLSQKGKTSATIFEAR